MDLFSFSGFSHYMLVINYAVRSSGVNARAVIFSYLHTFTFLPIPRSLFPAGFHAAVSIDFFQHHQNYYLKHVFFRAKFKCCYLHLNSVPSLYFNFVYRYQPH